MLKAALQRVLDHLGFQVVRSRTAFSPEELEIISKVRGYTSSSAERIVGLINAVKYLVANRIEGAFVECGVWRGGSMMAAMYALLNLGDTTREFYLYDTFEGMTPPTDRDVMFDGRKAADILKAFPNVEGPGNYWCIASIEDVQRNVTATGYPADKIRLIAGPVEQTLPAQAPARIALLRLDTDWYESTKHELIHLYPRLVDHGVLIIDDYGHWRGAREAVDEFFGQMRFRPMLHRLDYTGRLVIKPRTDN
jgi:O-methyltransferase